MDHAKEELNEENSTTGTSSANTVVSLTSLQSEEELMGAMSELSMEAENLYQRVMEWCQERGIEQGDPTSIFDQYTLKKRQSLVQSLRSQAADSNLNNS